MKTRAATGVGCLLLFAAPFCLGGLIAGGALVKVCWRWYEARTWDETAATLLVVGLEEGRVGSGSKTSRASARYRYRYRGTTYESERVALLATADSIGSFQEDLHRELESAFRLRRTVSCWVDPDQPSRSFLNRDLRPRFLGFLGIFSLVFSGAGIWIVSMPFRGRREVLEKEELEARYPGEPWRWNKEWSRGRVSSTDRQRVRYQLTFAGLWWLISAPILFILPAEVFEKGNWAALFGLVFPAAGIWLGRVAWRSSSRLRRFGVSELELSSWPVAVGAALEGRVFNRASPRRTASFEVSLRCVEKPEAIEFGSPSQNEKILWECREWIDGEPSSRPGFETGVPVFFEIPESATPTRAAGSSVDTLPVGWRLEISSVDPATDYQARFAVPVFESGAGRPKAPG